MTQGRVTEEDQLSHMVAWLDGQRKLDKDQLLGVQQDVERINLSVRELTAHISKVADDVAQYQSRMTTLPILEDGLRTIREMLLVLQQRVEENQELQGKEVLLRQAETERDRRSLVDVSQQILEIRRLVEIEDGKLRSVGDEIKRARASFETVPGQIDALDKAVSAVGSRVHVHEELVRRHDARLTLMEKTIENLQSENSRMLQWQQAAELRWSRQISGWQQQMEEWQREGEDRAKLVQQFIKQLAVVKEEGQAVRLGLGDVHKRSEEHAAEFLRQESLRTHDREEVRRVEQSIETQRRRIDEHTGTIKQLQEQFIQDVQELGTVQTRIESSQRRIDEVGARVSHLEHRHQQNAEDVDQVRREIREVNQRFEQHVQRLLLRAEEDRRRFEEIVEETARMDEQQKLRELAEVERQVTEIRERFSKARTS